MKKPPFFFGKYLFILLAFFSLAGNTSFAFSSEVLRTKTEAESGFQKTQKKALVYDQLENSEGYELAEKPFPGTGSFSSFEVRLLKRPLRSGSFSYLIIDLKAGITSRIFPSHFFL